VLCASASKAQSTVYFDFDAAGFRTKRTTVAPPPPCGNACRYNMHAYPNPATNITNLVIDEKLQGETMYIQMISVDGSIVKSFITSSTKHEINVANLVNGIYFIKLSTNKANMQYIFNKID
jgi:hypothetical protein